MQIAIAEVLTPTLGTTEQILAVHKVVTKNGVPAIVRVDNVTEPGAYFVYFELIDEPYYLVVVLRTVENKLVVSASYIEAAVRVYLLIVSDRLTPHEISSRIDLLPTKSYVKGVLNNRFPHIKSKQHEWFFEPEKDVASEFEHKLIFLLNRIEDKKNKIANLHDECQIYINICYEGYKDWMGGLHLDAQIVQKIAELRAAIDIDLYAYGPDLL